MCALKYGLQIALLATLVVGFRRCHTFCRHMWIHAPILKLNRKIAMSTRTIDSLTSPTLSSLIVKALESYGNVIGSHPIPTNFVIPENDSWPALLHGYRLGDHLSKIVAGSDFGKKFPQIANELDKLGISGQPLVSGWDIFYNAVLKFKTLHGHVNIPNKFVVPHVPPWTKLEWGLNLGAKLSLLRSSGQYVQIHDEKIIDLLQLGFEWYPQQKSFSCAIWSDDAFCRVVTGLLIFRDIYPNQDIPVNYSVPFVWPKELHMMKLGSIVNSLRNIFNISNRQQTKTDPDVGKIFEAVGVFARVNRGVSITPDFVVPVDQKWPTHLWKLHLGKSLIGLLENEHLAETKRKELIALLGPKQIKDLSPDKFGMVCDPAESSIILSNPRIALYDKERKTKLLSLLLNSRLSSRDGRIRKTAIYEGGMSGRDISNFVFGRRSSNTSFYDDGCELRYKRVEFGRYDWNDMLQSLHVFKELHGHLNVPTEYVIDRINVERGFPECCLGLDLGDAVASIRIGDVDAYDDEPRRTVLDNMGFVWGDTSKYLHFRFVPTWLGLKHFHFVHGHIAVGWNFVVPYSEEWPLWMMGMPLGQWLWTAKFQHVVLANHYPSRKQLLDSLKIKWRIPVGERLLLERKFFGKFKI